MMNCMSVECFLIEARSLGRFGMFVDVGAKRDGLVHVKDISKDYFITNHQSVSAAAKLVYCTNLSVNLSLISYLVC